MYVCVCEGVCIYVCMYVGIRGLGKAKERCGWGEESREENRGGKRFKSEG